MLLACVLVLARMKLRGPFTSIFCLLLCLKIYLPNICANISAAAAVQLVKPGSFGKCILPPPLLLHSECFQNISRYISEMLLITCVIYNVEIYSNMLNGVVLENELLLSLSASLFQNLECLMASTGASHRSHHIFILSGKYIKLSENWPQKTKLQIFLVQFRI